MLLTYEQLSKNPPSLSVLDPRSCLNSKLKLTLSLVKRNLSNRLEVFSISVIWAVVSAARAFAPLTRLASLFSISAVSS